jgi:lactoylglutathione lyase
MPTRLTYAVEFVADMDRAVAFYRDVAGLEVKFQSPEWTEFATGETTLALHPASETNPAGRVELGFDVEDIWAFHEMLTAKGVTVAQPPAPRHGVIVASALDSDGAQVTFSGTF